MTREVDGRLALAHPFSILAEPDAVILLAGEDQRYTVRGPGIERWAPDLLRRLSGALRVEELLAPLPPGLREPARTLLDLLRGERVLVAAPAEQAHRARPLRPAPEGAGPLVELLAAAHDPAAEPVTVLCQETLDYSAALAFERRMRAAGARWIWASHGALQRGYVGPLLLPDAGPCLHCLVARFGSISPAPGLHRALLDHTDRGGALVPAPFPAPALELLAAIVRWKCEVAALHAAPAALYRLHVVELATLEVTTHPVSIEPGCPCCDAG